MKVRRQSFNYQREHLAQKLEERGILFWLVVGLVFVALVGWLDLITGYEYAFSLFYLAPISLTAWYAGRRVGIPIAIMSGLLWLAAGVAAGATFSSLTAITWNTVVRTSVFLLLALLTADLRRAMREERRLSRTDGTTGALNARYFHNLLKLEIDRANRFGLPFTLAFIDMDNFKHVNDTFGHLKGDEVLYAFVSCAREKLRSSDMLGRMGGDEFAILLLELNAEEACVVLERIRANVVTEMSSRGMPVTLSMGAVTFLKSPDGPDHAIRMADHLMYAAKNAGKNRLHTSIYPEHSG